MWRRPCGSWPAPPARWAWTWSRGRGRMAKQGKRYREAQAKHEADRAYPLGEAVATLVSFPLAKFDESVELAINLGVDPRHADQMGRGAIVPPHGTGQEGRGLGFAQGGEGEEGGGG